MSGRWDAIRERTEAYYSARLREHGASARGVDWNSAASQLLRFDQLLRVVEPGREDFSLNDFGCGYGALVDHLARRGLAPRYHGLDLSAAMIESARERHTDRPQCRFTSSFEDVEPATYTVASGVFNVKQDTPADDWWDYVVDSLDRLRSISRRGFAFNILTLDSDPERREPHLFYADPVATLEHCRRRYSRWVALLQDYGLYEFTLIVRLDDNEKWPA